MKPTTFEDIRGRSARLDREIRLVTAAVKFFAKREPNTIPKGILLVGPPSITPTMLARRLGSVLPEIDAEANRRLTYLYQLARLIEKPGEWNYTAPFRAPHCTISGKALAGRKCGTPGEYQLATAGVLLLDELPEFTLQAIERLSTAILASRYAPLIVASARPCPCGYKGSDIRACLCKDRSLELFTNRVKRFARLLHLEQKFDINQLSLAELRGIK